jgi:uroporphyrinogen decarboxylase
LPYLKTLYNRKVSVKFLHNDAQWQSSTEFLPEAGINLFNMAFDTSLNELKSLTKNQITMLGNIPPRDVLAKGTAGEIKTAVKGLTESLTNRSRVILSCGEGCLRG